jgi:DNA-binding CsgD family transcriptional regulator
MPCVAAVAYIVLFAAVDALLEAHVATAQQMVIRLVVVSTALVGAVTYVLLRARVAQEQVRLMQEQAERRVQAAQEEARLAGALLTMRELAPWLAHDAPHLASAAEAIEVSGAAVLRESGHGAEVASLTPREREIAILIAHGRTSREIAEHLIITERTVDTHADRIRAKLGLRSRAEIAAWVLSHGLSSNSRRSG